MGSISSDDIPRVLLIFLQRKKCKIGSGNIVLCQKFEIAISAGRKSRIMMRSLDDYIFSPLGRVFQPAHGHFVLLGNHVIMMVISGVARPVGQVG